MQIRMGHKNSVVLALAVAALLTATGILLKFGTYLSFPPGKVIEPYGDGFKAYMSTAYHAMYDSSATHFQGMHYPYGDHLVFSDPQPLLANALQLIYPAGPGLGQVAINWTHALMLLSILACALLMCSIFLRLGMPAGYAALAGPMVAFLSPMLARIGFHYGLAQPAAIPAVLYLLLVYQERQRWATSLGIGLTVLFFSLFHFQYFGILFVGLSAYFLTDFLYRPRRDRLLRMALHFSLQAILPLLALALWLSAGSGVVDRASRPFGFLHYRARIAGTFTAADQPHWQPVLEYFGINALPDIEARNYIGLVAMLGLLFFLGKLLRRYVARPVRSEEGEGPGQAYLNRLFWAGLLVFIFSTGFPFTLPNLEQLVGYLGPLKQFRALGRFSWFFFFSANIIALSTFVRASGSKKWVPPAVLLILGAEAFFFLRARDLRLDPVEGQLPEQPLLAQVGIDPGEFQAILPIPYFHIGSDNFWLEPEGFIQQNAMVLALQSGLPLCAAMMSRTSVGQTFRQLQLVGEPYRTPRILEDYPNRKPLLMLVDKERFRSEAPRWDHFGGSGTGIRFIKDLGRMAVFAVPLSHFEANAERQREIVAAELAGLPLFQRGIFRLSDSTAVPVTNAWDATPTPSPYQGKGGFSAAIRQVNTVFDDQLPGQAPGKRYMFSIWMYLDADMRGTTSCTLLEYDPAGRKAIASSTTTAGSAARVFDPGGWALLEVPFRTNAAGSRVRISFHNPDAAGTLFLDEMLIRPEGVDVYMQKKGVICKNNRWYFAAAALE
ncbi:MAG: hypothetical protein RL386_1087 [Bacteroidota bacterium]